MTTVGDISRNPKGGLTVTTSEIGVGSDVKNHSLRDGMAEKSRPLSPSTRPQVFEDKGQQPQDTSSPGRKGNVVRDDNNVQNSNQNPGRRLSFIETVKGWFRRDSAHASPELDANAVRTTHDPQALADGKIAPSTVHSFFDTRGREDGPISYRNTPEWRKAQQPSLPEFADRRSTEGIFHGASKSSPATPDSGSDLPASWTRFSRYRSHGRQSPDPAALRAGRRRKSRSPVEFVKNLGKRKRRPSEKSLGKRPMIYTAPNLPIDPPLVRLTPLTHSSRIRPRGARPLPPRPELRISLPSSIFTIDSISPDDSISQRYRPSRTYRPSPTSSPDNLSTSSAISIPPAPERPTPHRVPTGRPTDQPHYFAATTPIPPQTPPPRRNTLTPSDLQPATSGRATPNGRPETSHTNSENQMLFAMEPQESSNDVAGVPDLGLDMTRRRSSQGVTVDVDGPEADGVSVVKSRLSTASIRVVPASPEGGE